MSGNEHSKLPAGADDTAVAGHHQIVAGGLGGGSQDDRLAGGEGLGGFLIPDAYCAGAAPGERHA